MAFGLWIWLGKYVYKLYLDLNALFAYFYFMITLSQHSAL